MISIIIPAYNRQDYIGHCVRSALGQSFEDIEVIIVDDGSKDSTGAICDSMAVKEGRIKVIHQTNAGVSAARQAGIDAARGEWICFLDSDDSLPQRALENYSESFDGAPDIIVSGHSGNLDFQGYLLGITDYSIRPTLWGKLFKGDFLKKNMPLLPREIVMGEDMIANLVLGMNALSFRTVASLQYNVTLDNKESAMKTFRSSFEYENYFFGVLNELFLSKCSSLPFYEELARNTAVLKLNGYKNVVLNRGLIDVRSEDWLSFKAILDKGAVPLSPSDRLFLGMEKHQHLFCKLMGAYLKIRQRI